MKCKICKREYFGLTLFHINPETEICVNCQILTELGLNPKEIKK